MQGSGFRDGSPRLDAFSLEASKPRFWLQLPKPYTNKGLPLIGQVVVRRGVVPALGVVRVCQLRCDVAAVVMIAYQDLGSRLESFLGYSPGNSYPYISRDEGRV